MPYHLISLECFYKTIIYRLDNLNYKNIALSVKYLEYLIINGVKFLHSTGYTKSLMICIDLIISGRGYIWIRCR
jgi:hypothetical protein